MSALQTAKFWLVGHLGLAKDALHVYVALILFFGGIALFRWRPGDWRPLILVVLAALLGEAWDVRDRAAGGVAQDYAANWHDVWNTCFWPAAVTALARWTSVFRR